MSPDGKAGRSCFLIVTRGESEIKWQVFIMREEEKSQIYLTALFGKETADALSPVSAALAGAGLTGRQSTNIPHITLGRVPDAGGAEIMRRVRTICVQTAAFEIKINHVGLFGQDVLFAGMAANHELLQLRSSLFPDEQTAGAHNWVAHITLFIDIPDNVCEAIPIVTKTFKPFTARIEKVGVFAFPPAKFIETVSLAQGHRVEADG